eukprot:SAG22_NODE_670_length_7987_cov_2.733519_5_plen_178_part_00
MSANFSVFRSCACVPACLQMTIIVNFLAAILLSEQNTRGTGVSPEQIEMGIILCQQIMMLYLVYVIFVKVSEMVRVSKKEVHEEQLMMKQMKKGSEPGRRPGTQTIEKAAAADDDDDDEMAAEGAIKTAFSFFDKDGGGSVNLYEIQSVLSIVGIKLGEQTLPTQLLSSEFPGREMG